MSVKLPGCGEPSQAPDRTRPGGFHRLRFRPAAERLGGEVPAVPPYLAERYTLGRMLGDGNFAVVRECVERSTGREYALKIINKGKCRGKVRRAPGGGGGGGSSSDSIITLCLFQEHMIQNEVAILRRVKHPNIVLLIEEVDTYNELYLVMELVKAGVLG